MLTTLACEVEGNACHTSLMQLSGQSCPAAGAGMGVSVVNPGVTVGVRVTVAVSDVIVSTTGLVAVAVLVDSKKGAVAVGDDETGGCDGCRVAMMVIAVTVTVPHRPIKAAIIVGSIPFLVDIDFRF